MFGIYRTATAGISIILPFLVLPIIKKYSPEKLLKYSALSISLFLLLISGCVYLGRQNIYLSVILITILDCLIISSVMPLNIATQVFFQKILKMNIEVELCLYLVCL